MTPSLLRKIVAVFFAAIVLAITAKAQKPAPTIPVFNFARLDNSSFTNKDLAQNKLLFFCFFDPSCDHCQRALGKINTHLADFNKAALYFISLDNAAGIKNFMQHYAPNIPKGKNVTLLQDNQNEFIKKFKPLKYPGMFLYDRNKKLLHYDDDEQHTDQFFKLVKSGGKQ